MNYLLTGASGFLGNCIYKTLLEHGHYVMQITRRSSLQANEQNIFCDLSKSSPNLRGRTIEKVVHAAGKAHSIPQTQEEAQAFYEVNKTGVQHLLDALEKLERYPRVFVNISTVSVYGSDTGILIDEQHPTNANTPYGISKMMGEKLVTEWCAEKGINFYNLRLPLVVGNYPPGNLGKMIQAILKGYYLKLKDNTARKSAVLATDVAKLIVSLQEQPSGAYNLTDGYHPSVMEIEHALELAVRKKICFQLSKKAAANFIRVGNLIKILGKRNPADHIYKKITASLTFSDEKARKELEWTSENVLNYLPNIMF
ncbi:NAD-dependent epimerase/dehydratase family protein [Chitinophaga cymbidii]|uniref:UDP-galactose-4-epimerase n=1 Tax=Chitinophaga cymbidii TaxID=1096750 RepID=A0A512RGF9_9BACT|nr:NAD-dependent epimerase/dehydratase family protein [Chitinophaga cymbidii]GEP94790.1 UDP-galactose-4-epimerase [Chitinophaga cymbidii]